MRYKVVPEPRDVSFLRAAHEALPLVPGSVDDCCTRIRNRTDVPSRDAAREWLTFLQALGLAAETERGYHRVREPPGDDELAAAFVENVFLVRELVDRVRRADQPTSTPEAFGIVRDEIPRWERERYADWEREWRDRVRKLLEWSRTFGLVSKDGAQYFGPGA